MKQEVLQKNYETILEKIELACSQAKRTPNSVKLLAVSKFHAVESMLYLHSLGQQAFGENYVQEALAKMQVFANLGVDARDLFHLIGHIQSRKAHQVAGKFALIHALDSEKVALAMEKSLAVNNMTQKVLIEVNLGQEVQKAGLAASAVFAFADYLKINCQHLSLEGLMCIPPVVDAPNAARPYFAELRTLKEQLETHLGHKLPELSMGMSGDFEAAIMEGATIVRIGTALFGPRPVHQN